jgi:phage repressor protein C with HTH and peptisase S24 domain
MKENPISETQENRRKRLASICITPGDQARIAAAYPCEPSYISNLIAGKKPISEKVALKLEWAANKPRGWFDRKDENDFIEGQVVRLELPPHVQPKRDYSAFFGEFDLWDSSTPLRSDEVALPFFRELEMAGGLGRSEVVENHGLKLRFAKSTLRKKSVQPENAACAVIAGNSMEPVIPDGSTIWIDKGNTRIKDGEIYAIDHDGELRIKMLYKRPSGGIRVSSYNKDEWPDENYTPEEAQKIRILGYVFGWSVLR